MRPKHDAGQRYRRVEFASDILPVEPSTLTLDLRSIWRHRWSISAIVVLFAMLGIAFAMLKPISYSASTRLVIDHRNPSLTVNNTVFMTSDLSGNLVDSQVEILRSQKVMARALNLVGLEISESLVPGPSLSSKIMKLLAIKDDAPLSDEQLQTLKLAQLENLITVSRIGETFTIEILARGSDPQMAMRLATAMSDAFLDDQAKANAKAARGASPWLLERLINSGTTARVIADATLPLVPDGPNSKYVIIAFAFAGLVLGIGAAFTYDILDTRIRTPEQAAGVAGAECLGVMNVFRRGDQPLHDSDGVKIKQSKWTEYYPFPADSSVFKSCCDAVTLERPDLKTLGVTSCTPGEGKSTIAVNVARAIAASGQRVLLVDAATDNAELTQQLSRPTKARKDLFGVLFGKTQLGQAILKEPGTGVQFLPYGFDMTDQDQPSIWSRLNLDLDKLISRYDIVVFDLPAINADSSARAAAQLLDGMLLVIEYGKLPEDVAVKILEKVGSARNSILSVILNKVNEANYKTYANLKPKFRTPVRKKAKLGTRKAARTSLATGARHLIARYRHLSNAFRASLSGSRLSLPTQVRSSFSEAKSKLRLPGIRSRFSGRRQSAETA